MKKCDTLIELSPASILWSVLHTVCAIARTLQDFHHPSGPTAPMDLRVRSIRPIAALSVSCRVFRIHESLCFLPMVSRALSVPSLGRASLKSRADEHDYHPNSNGILASLIIPVVAGGGLLQGLRCSLSRTQDGVQSAFHGHGFVLAAPLHDPPGSSAHAGEGVPTRSPRGIPPGCGCILHISKIPPPVRAIATPHAGVPIDGLEKFWYLFCVNIVFNRDHDWAVVRRRVPLQYGGHPPMSPGCQISG